MATPDEVYELAAKDWEATFDVNARWNFDYPGVDTARILAAEPPFRAAVDAAFAAGRRAAAEAIRAEARNEPPTMVALLERVARFAEGSRDVLITDGEVELRLMRAKAAAYESIRAERDAALKVVEAAVAWKAAKWNTLAGDAAIALSAAVDAWKVDHP